MKRVLAIGVVFAAAVLMGAAPSPAPSAADFPATTDEVIACQKPCNKTQQACLHTCYDGKPNAPRSCGQACEDALVACNKACIARYGIN